MRNLYRLSILGFGLLLTAGCGNLSVNFTEATSPQFWAVENQTQAQHNQIEAAVQANQIPFTVGEGLTVNDEIIRRLNHQFRDESSGATDLSPSQAVLLGHMLKDNDRAFTDAVENIDDWQDSFNQEDAYIQNNHAPLNNDFVHFAQRARFIVYLNMRLKEDSAKAQSLAQANQLSVEQAQDLQSALNDVQNKAVEDYYANGDLDLSVDQIFQLRRMLSDSYASLNPPEAPTYGGSGGYNVPTNTWSGNWGPSYNPPAAASGYTYYNSPANNGGSNGSRPSTPASPTPNATVMATATPNPGHLGTMEKLRLNHQNPGSGPYSVQSNPPTATPVPPTPEPTDTPEPVAQNTPDSFSFPSPAPADNPAPANNGGAGSSGNSPAQNNPGNWSLNNPPFNGNGPRAHSNQHGNWTGNNAPADNSNPPTPTATADDSATGPGN